MFFLFIIVFILIPFPICVTIDVAPHRYQIKLYGFKLNIKAVDKKKSIKNAKVKEAFKKEVFQSFPENLASSGELKFKPILRLNIKAELGLEDAAFTAITCGILNSLCPIIYKAMRLFFTIGNFKFGVYPDFENSKMNFSLKGTVFINIFVILYLFQKGLRIYYILRKKTAASILKESI